MIKLQELLDESQKNDCISYNSEIDPTFKVFIFYKENENYKTIRILLGKFNNSIAALNVGTKNILMDGERIEKENLSKNHLLAIEAHEIAHSLLNHPAGTSQEQEIEADKKALEILYSKGYTVASKILKNRLNLQIQNK